MEEIHGIWLVLLDWTSDKTTPITDIVTAKVFIAWIKCSYNQ